MIENFSPNDSRRQIFEFYRDIEKNINSKLANNYSNENFDLNDQETLTYFKKDNLSNPSIFSTIYRRSWWPIGVYRILNRTWQYPRNNSFGKNINSGLYEMIIEQLNYCRSLSDFKTAIITRDKNTRLFDKMIQDLKLRGIQFKKAKDKIRTYIDISENSYQYVLYYGDDAVIENWNKSDEFHIKILNVDHFNDIKDIYNLNLDNNRQNNAPNNRYFYALEKYYLNESDKDHILFGLFFNKRLIAYVGIRYDLPKEHSDSWIISYFKISPGTDLITNNSFKKLWLYICNYAESKRKIKFYYLIDKKREQIFNHLFEQTTEFDNRYDFYTICEIPETRKSKIEWVHSLMGSMIDQNKNYIVRTGILKAYLKDV